MISAAASSPATGFTEVSGATTDGATTDGATDNGAGAGAGTEAGTVVFGTVAGALIGAGGGATLPLAPGFCSKRFSSFKQLLYMGALHLSTFWGVLSVSFIVPVIVSDNFNSYVSK